MYSGPCPDGIGGLRGRLPGIPARGTRGREAHDVRRQLELVLLLTLVSWSLLPLVSWLLLLLVSWLLLPLRLLWLRFVHLHPPHVGRWLLHAESLAIP